jgi:hypothetical protein
MAMNLLSFQTNLVIAWLWILIGFVSGMVLGMFFHDEKWLGGYASFRRRMYRLAHISFFGLGAVNLLFWLTVKNLPVLSGPLRVASIGFVIGALSMPVCSVVMAHFPRTHLIFSIPVLSLIAGGVLTLMAVARSDEKAGRLVGATSAAGVVYTEEPVGRGLRVAPITISTNNPIPLL